MAKINLSKEQEDSLLMRGDERLMIERVDNQFTALFKPEADLKHKPTLKSVNPKKVLSEQIRLFEVPAKDRDNVMEEIRHDDDALFCHHVYCSAEDHKSRFMLTDQIIAQFKEEVTDDQISKVLDKYHLEIVEEFSDQANNFLLRVTPDSGANPIKVSNRLHGEGLTKYSEPNLIVQYQKYFEPSDAKFAKQWHLKNRGGVQLVAGADVDAPSAWDITTGARSVIVAVIDDGFDLDHPDLQGDSKIVAPIDFHFLSTPTNINPNPDITTDLSPLPEGGDYHGTPCAGVAVAELGRGDVVGIAPECSLMPIRWPFMSTDKMAVDMFTHAYQMGASVISCSWGPGPGIHPISSKFKQVLNDVATKGRGGKGCLIMFAAGNDNIPLNDTLNGQRHLNGEASDPNVMAIAASTSQNKKAAYSGWGREISVCAPSNNFWPGDSSRKLSGRGVVTTDNGAHGSGFDPSIYTERFGGTSSATPLAAGVAALVIAANPTLTSQQVREIVETTADKIEDHDPDPQLGLKKGTYDNNGYSEWFGFGKVNAASAVQKARDLLKEETGISELKMETTAEGNLSKKGEVEIFKFSLGDKLSINLKGPDNSDFDLYIKQGSEPTINDFDARGYSPSANEKVVLHPVSPGDYYVMVRSFSGSGEFEVKLKLV